MSLIACLGVIRADAVQSRAVVPVDGVTESVVTGVHNDGSESDGK